MHLKESGVDVFNIICPVNVLVPFINATLEERRASATVPVDILLPFILEIFAPLMVGAFVPKLIV